MLGNLKRWMSSQPVAADVRGLSNWAQQHNQVFKTVRDERGGVVECETDNRQWRIEWGEPQRSYIKGSELRLREELGLSPDFQMLVISRKLAEQLESDVFERFTEAMQTQIDNNMPEEMRWLAMFPKVNLSAFKPLRAKLLVLCSLAPAAEAWLQGEVAQALEAALGGFLASDPSFVLMALRGRLYLRLEAPAVDEALLDATNVLFEVAGRRARSLGDLLTDAGAASGGWSSTSATAWQSHASGIGDPDLNPRG
ncbi:hypothetical protein [Aquabacterium sp.]|uniref:hypothetical protein n=1 Tax=Aquabacterium sp. TaxID=1872578 RepID=UPI0035B2EAA9